MIYLLDTDSLIFVVRGLKSARRPAQRARAQQFAARCQQAQATGHAVGLSAITLSELDFGARNSANYASEMAAVQKIVAPFDLYDYDAAVCPTHYGQIRYELESHGMVIGSMDLMIAAHALALDATLISNNQSHFKRVAGLRTESWIGP